MVFDDEMLTIDEVAKYLKLKPQTIYKWAQSGKIPGAKFGKEWRFRRSLIEEWIDSHILNNSKKTPPRAKSRPSPSRSENAAKQSQDTFPPQPDSGTSRN